MIKGNIGSVELAHKSILVGQNHIVVPYKVKNDLTGLTAGTAVALADGEITHLTADTDDAIGILYKDVELTKDKSKDATSLVIVFGAVKKAEVTFKEDATACTEQLVEKLRKNGVYAIN